MGIVSWIFWGLFVGAIARLLLPGRQAIGIIWTILLGVAGAVVGGFFATEALGIGEIGDFSFGSFLIAVAGAFVLLAVATPLLERTERRREAEERR